MKYRSTKEKDSDIVFKTTLKTFEVLRHEEEILDKRMGDLYRWVVATGALMIAFVRFSNQSGGEAWAEADALAFTPVAVFFSIGFVLLTYLWLNSRFKTERLVLNPHELSNYHSKDAKGFRREIFQIAEQEFKKWKSNQRKWRGSVYAIMIIYILLMARIVLWVLNYKLFGWFI